MDTTWCKEVLEEAIEVHDKPEIINTDQSSPYTLEEFSSFIPKNGIKLSMGGKG